MKKKHDKTDFKTTLEKMSLFTVTRSSNQQQQKIYIYLKLTVDLLLRAMMPFFFDSFQDFPV